MKFSLRAKQAKRKSTRKTSEEWKRKAVQKVAELYPDATPQSHDEAEAILVATYGAEKLTR